MIFVYLFSVFFKIGIFSFGGGLAMLPLIFQSVQDFGFMSSEDFSNLVALSQITPGPIAVNAATFVGYNYAGIPGAAVATLGVSLPAFLIMLIVMKCLDKFHSSRTLQGALAGIRPVTVGLIAAASVFVAENVLVKGPVIATELVTDFTDYVNVVPCLIFVITLILAGKFKVNPIVICIIMGIIGAILCG
jgi:chromate transporter